MPDDPGITPRMVPMALSGHENRRRNGGERRDAVIAILDGRSRSQSGDRTAMFPRFWSTTAPIPVSGVVEGVGAPGRILTNDPRLRRPRIASCLLRPVPPSGQHPYGPRDEEMTPRSVRSLSRPAVTAERHARFADLGRFFAPRGVRPGLIRGRPLRPPARRPRDTRPAARPPGASRLR